MQGPCKGGALSPVLIVQATSEEVHRVYYKPRHKPMLSWSGAFMQGPTVVWAPGSKFSEPNTAIRAPAPPTAAARRREEEAVGRSLRTGSTHGAVWGRPWRMKAAHWRAGRGLKS